MKVLPVEDHPVSRELAHDLLVAAGHQVLLACDADEFRALLAARQVPHVVLMDIRLQGADGATLLKEMKRLAEVAHVPVVAVTAHAMQGDIAKLRADGFDDVITKPLDTRTFCRQIEARVGEGGQ